MAKVNSTARAIEQWRTDMITSKTKAIVSLTTHGVRTKNILRTLDPIL